MAIASASIPADTDLLCEGCGYTLNGLATGSNCPECGKPIAESDPILRAAPTWERPVDRSRFAAFRDTTLSIIGHPARFYRSLSTRGNARRARQFAHLHMAIAGSLFGLAGLFHSQWLFNLNQTRLLPRFSNLAHLESFADALGLGVGCMVGGYAMMVLIAWIAARLTSLEARFWGLRLPLSTVDRVMSYHAAHYLPVSVIVLATIGGFALLRAVHVLSFTSDVLYLYMLCGEVIVGAVYLFRRYWIGMKSMMYANP